MADIRPATDDQQAAAARTAPARHGVAVTPNDSTDLGQVTRGLYIGTTGDVVVDFVGGDTTIKFTAVPAGQILPIRVSRVRSTNTTATNIVALY